MHSPGLPVITESHPTSTSASSISSLPMNPKNVRWPGCFSGVCLSHNSDCREVMLNESAGDQVGKVWKFYPSPRAGDIENIVSTLKTREPFSADSGMSDDLDTLLEFSQLWCIDDGFTNHPERRKFLEDQPEVSKYVEHTSKLRRNCMNYLPMAVNSFCKTFPSIPCDFLVNLGRALNQNGYNDKTFEEKREFVYQVDAEILRYLNAIHSSLS